LWLCQGCLLWLCHGCLIIMCPKLGTISQTILAQEIPDPGLNDIMSQVRLLQNKMESMNDLQLS
ncbi:MAG: hypothetical protein AAFW67_13355, partial [Cyanobacteria bacterium J06638_38]